MHYCAALTDLEKLNTFWSVVTWQRFQDVCMGPLTSAQDFRVVTLATQTLINEAIKSISKSCTQER